MQFVEYIQNGPANGQRSSGWEIDLNYVPTQNTRVVLGVNFTGPGDGDIIFGTAVDRGGFYRFFTWLQSGQMVFDCPSDYDSGRNLVEYAFRTYADFELGIDSNGRSYISNLTEGKTTTNSSSNSYNFTHPLTLWRSTSSLVQGTMFYYIDIYEGNVKTMELRPAISDNNVVGLYDNIGLRFYGPPAGANALDHGAVLSSIVATTTKTTLKNTGETITINVTCENSWTVSQTDNWLTLSSTGDTGSTAITATAPNYTGSTDRTTILTFTDSVTGDEAVLNLKQKKYVTGQPVYLGGDEISEIYLGGDEIFEAYLGDVLVFSKSPKIDYLTTPLTFEIVTGGTIEWSKRYSYGPSKVIEYSINDGQWTPMTATTAGTSFNVSDGDIVKFRGDNSTYCELDNNEQSFVFATFENSTAYFNVYGNIMSLIDSTGYESATTLTSAFTFEMMFAGTNVKSAENLMLPATTLTNGCYNTMFWECVELNTAPQLPATNLSSGCYRGMFMGCSGLEKAPILSTQNLVSSCYNDMFKNCTNLNYIECYATDISASDCTQDWVYNVASTGTFVKDPNMYNWTTGVNGIPSGWILESNSSSLAPDPIELDPVVE